MSSRQPLSCLSLLALSPQTFSLGLPLLLVFSVTTSPRGRATTPTSTSTSTHAHAGHPLLHLLPLAGAPCGLLSVSVVVVSSLIVIVALSLCPTLQTGSVRLIELLVALLNLLGRLGGEAFATATVSASLILSFAKEDEGRGTQKRGREREGE